MSFQEVTKIADACLSDETGGLNDFQNNLFTEFATNPKCKSLKFILFSNPATPNKDFEKIMDVNHYMLSINFTPGGVNQIWQMTTSPKSNQYTQGKGTINEITDKVCQIANGNGAEISN